MLIVTNLRAKKDHETLLEYTNHSIIEQIRIEYNQPLDESYSSKIEKLLMRMDRREKNK